MGECLRASARPPRQNGVTRDEPVPNASANGLAHDAVAAAVGEILRQRLDTSTSWQDAVHRVSVCGTRAAIHLALQVSGAEDLVELDDAITRRVRQLGATDVDVVIRRPETSAATPARRRGDPWAGQVRLGTAKHVVAVGAGKGGVGKSTIAVNLALTLAREGLRTGLLDADIYGPSLPILLGIEDGAARARMTPERYIVPLEAHGLPLVSFGFFLGAGSPAIWRGPMVAKAVQQFARGVAWPPLDVLIVDLPPGTGDVPLSLAQAIELSGAVVVTQPARVATAEARNAVQMFTSLHVPVLGVVENMTGVFGVGGGRLVSQELQVPFLGGVPFDPEIIHEGDMGTPTAIGRGDSAAAVAFDRIGQRIAEALGWARDEAGRARAIGSSAQRGPAATARAGPPRPGASCDISHGGRIAKRPMALEGVVHDLRGAERCPVPRRQHQLERIRAIRAVFRGTIEQTSDRNVPERQLVCHGGGSQPQRVTVSWCRLDAALTCEPAAQGVVRDGGRTSCGVPVAESGEADGAVGDPADRIVTAHEVEAAFAAVEDTE